MNLATALSIAVLYLTVGCITAICSVITATFNGRFSPYTADENDEIAIGNIVLMWPAYVILTIKDEKDER